MSHPDKQTAGARPCPTLSGQHGSSAKASMGVCTPMEANKGSGVNRQTPPYKGVITVLGARYLPTMVLRFVPLDSGAWISFHRTDEGVFIYFSPLEIAFLRPGFQL